MRELELQLHDALRAGLKPEYSLPMQGLALVDCNGFRCGKLWLEGHRPLIDPLINYIDPVYNWPFPQVLSGSKFNILVVREEDQLEDRLYSLSPDGLKSEFIISLDWDVFGRGHWYDLADFGRFAVVANGQVMLNFDVSSNSWYVDREAPVVETICNFNGQAVAGGVKTSWYDCDESYIIWSDIGNYDFTLNRGNKAGYRRDHFGGKVYRVKTLGNSVIVYSSAGLTQMLPVVEPAPAFGFSPISDIGLLCPSALAGSDNVHVFVDKNRNLCRLTGKDLEVLGYKHYMEELSSKIVVSYDKLTKDFYIGDGQNTYLLSLYGLTRVKQNISTIWHGEETFAAVGSHNDYPYFILFDEFDFGFRASKTLFSLELSAKNFSSARAAIQWRNGDEAFKATALKPFNRALWVSHIVSGTDFRIYVEFDEVSSETIVDYVKVRYKMTDLRNLRGIYAPPPRGQILE